MFVTAPEVSGARIEVKVPSRLLNYDEFERRLPETIIDAAVEARTFWETLAGQRLTTSRERYQSAIGMQQIADNEVHLMITDKFALDVEEGRSSFDMKAGFLNSPKLRTGPVKMPRAIAASLPKTKQPGASKWMIIPMNLGRQSPVSQPTFRVFTDKQPASMWIHPGFKGVNIKDDVVKELREEILPRHIEKLIDEVIRSGT